MPGCGYSSPQGSVECQENTETVIKVRLGRGSVSKPTHRLANLSQWRPCSPNVAQNCCWKGTSIGHDTWAFACVTSCLLLHSSNVIRGERGEPGDTKGSARVPSFCLGFLYLSLAASPTQLSTVYFRSLLIDLDSIWYVKVLGGSWC